MSGRGLDEARKARGSFYDNVADLYDGTRTEYPAALINDIVAFAQPGPEARILEIGCGTGQATAAFVTPDFKIVALEPGPNLARIARDRFVQHSNVRVICDTFEHWTVEAGAFDLVLSGRAFHWVERKVRFVKAAEALRPGGVLAIFNNIALPGITAVHEALRRSLGADADPLLATRRQWPNEREFTKSRYFEKLTRHSYAWNHDDDTETYVRRLSTSNRYRRLAAERRPTALSTIRDIIDAHGGMISTPYVSQLMMAHRNTRSLWRRRFTAGGLGK